MPKFSAYSWFESNNIVSTIGQIDTALFNGALAFNNSIGEGKSGTAKFQGLILAR